MRAAEITRPEATLIRSMLDQGLTLDDVAQALDRDVPTIQQARYWRATSTFTRAERAQYRDLLRFASFRLPYWDQTWQGRLELIPAEARKTRRAERETINRERAASCPLPESVWEV